MSNLPESWQIVKLGDISNITYGKGLPTKNLKSQGFPVFGANGIIGFYDKYLYGKSQLLISCRGANSGTINTSPPHCFITNNSLIVNFLVEQETLRKIYYYFLQAANKERLVTGTAQPQVTINNALEIELPLPPLNEQKRIVAKIEELFSELDKAIKHLKTAQAQLKVYRQAVLKYAFEGKLTATWREENKGSLETVEELLDRIGKKLLLGDKIASLPILPEGWAWIKSGDLFSMVTSGSRGWAKFYSESGSLFIRIGNMDFDSLKLDLADLQYVKPPIGAEGKRTKVENGDFLFSITGYLGMFAIAPKLQEAYVNQHIALARPVEGFNKEFVGYYIIAKTGGYHYLNSLTKGAVKAGLRLDDIKSFPVPMCSLEEQEKVVEIVKKNLFVVDTFEQTIDCELQKAEALRQSILKKAFSGKLVAQDPNDEPASLLLERIRSDKKLEKASHNKPLQKRGGTYDLLSYCG